MSEIEKARIKQLEQDVQDYDEVHAYISEISEKEGEKDLRSKDVEFDHDACLVTIKDEPTFFRVKMEHIIYWTPPRGF